jgi:hypothetical protein
MRQHRAVAVAVALLLSGCAQGVETEVLGIVLEATDTPSAATTARPSPPPRPARTPTPTPTPSPTPAPATPTTEPSATAVPASPTPTPPADPEPTPELVNPDAYAEVGGRLEVDAEGNWTVVGSRYIDPDTGMDPHPAMGLPDVVGGTDGVADIRCWVELQLAPTQRLTGTVRLAFSVDGVLVAERTEVVHLAGDGDWPRELFDLPVQAVATDRPTAATCLVDFVPAD